MRQVAHVLLTRPPLNPFPKELHSLDLHVLGTPPAFVLSQDQTLNKKFNLLLKLLWVFIRLKRIAGFILTIFCSIFKDHFLRRPQATSLSYHQPNFLSTFFWNFFCFLIKCCLLSWRLSYNIIIKIICQHILLIFFIFFKI